MSAMHKGLLKTLKWQQNVVLPPPPGFNHILSFPFSRDPPWGAITFKLRVNASLLFCIPIHSSLPGQSTSPLALSAFQILFSFLLGLERGRKNHSISPSVCQEPKIPARDAIWYKSIIMKVQHGAKWVSTSAARGANDKTASLCSLACR